MQIIAFLWMSNQIIPKKQTSIIPIIENFKQDMFESAKNPGLLLPKILHKKTSTDVNFFCSDHVSVMLCWS